MKTYQLIRNRMVWMVVLIIFTVTGNISHAAESVYATVKIEIKQEMTLERQAFDAHIRINNGLTNITLEDVKIEVIFEDEEYNSVYASSDT